MVASQGASDSEIENEVNDNGIKLIKNPEAMAKNNNPATGTNVLFDGGVSVAVCTLFSFLVIVY